MFTECGWVDLTFHYWSVAVKYMLWINKSGSIKAFFYDQKKLKGEWGN